MLAASTSANVSLHANQEETEAAPVETGLAVPDDLSGEALEAIDAALATSLGPSLEIAFDAAKSSQERLAAAGEIERIAQGINATSPALNVLKRHLLRRSALIIAAVRASEASTEGSPANSHSAQLAQAVSETEAMLNAMSNGAGWLTYLHLADLQSGTASSEMKEQAIRNLTSSESMNNAQLVFLNRPAFQNLKAALESAVAAEAPAADEAAARTALTTRINSLVSALLAYEKNALAVDAEKARTEWRSLRSRFPAAADVMRTVVNEHYFNHNVHFTVSEELLSRLISDYRTESGSIADCVMGAWVTGSQTTSVDVRADIRPSTTTARFDLSVNGNTQSNTKAQKSPATVWTNGNHYFWMNRSVFFDGRNVSATPANFSVDTNSRTVGLATKYDGIPIIRGIVRRMASQKIAESKPQADAMTADRMRDEALPKFQSETD
jgi:hypothetical protein